MTSLVVITRVYHGQQVTNIKSFA